MIRPSLHPSSALDVRRPGLRPLLVLAGLVAFAAGARLLPHVPNVAPVAAIALFAGFFFKNRLLAAAAPIAAMLVSDAVIGGYHPAVMAVVYASLAAPIFFRPLMGNGSSLPRVFGGAAVGALAGSILFFVASNLAVWAYSGYYPPSAAGLGECFLAALPFFRFTALGDLAFAMTLFGAWACIARAATLLQPARAETTAVAA